MSASQTRPHLRALTGLRFVAALQVVILHYVSGLLTDVPAPIFNIAASGYVAVNLFFVLSGFVLTYTYVGRQSNDGLDKLEKKPFFISRFARIYPVYALSVCVMVLYYLVTIAKNQTESPQLNLAEVLTSGGVALLMVQAWTVKWLGLTNTPGWSLSVEALFYVLFPFIAALLSRLSPRRLFVSVGLIWALGLAIASLYLVIQPDGPLSRFAGVFVITPGSWLSVVVYNPLLHLPEFLIGVATAKLFLRRTATVQQPRASALNGWLSLGTLALILLVLMASQVIPLILLFNGLLAPLFAVLIYNLARGGGILHWALSRPALVLLGEASYALYILQEPLWKWSLSVAATLTGRHTIWTEPGFVLLYIGLLVLVSLLSFRLVEQPAGRFLRRVLSGRAPAAKPGVRTAGATGLSTAS